MTKYHNTINGKPVAAPSHFDVINPATAGVFASCPSASEEQLNDAVAAAQQAFVTWSKTSDDTRKVACLAIADVIDANADELAMLLTSEQGKPLAGRGSRAEVGGMAVWARVTGALEMLVKTIKDDNEGKIEVFRKPVGVVGSITPWNFPLMIAVWHILPAIRAGNTVVIKPSPYTPLSTLRFIELINAVLPAGVINSVAGADVIGAKMSAHSGINKIVFTGSTDTGKKIMSSGSVNLKRLTLELGGNDAGIVLPDCDPAKIAEGLFWGAFINNGQTCAALKRLYVHEDIHDAVCDELIKIAKTIKVGEGFDEASVLGPLQNKMQYDKVAGYLQSAKDEGGIIAYQGEAPDGPGYFHPITIVTGLNNGNTLVDQEQFGPVLPIIKFKDVDSAIAKANDNPNGLGASVWSANAERAKEIAMQLDSGTAWINGHSGLNPMAPFGGVKSSGIGVEFGDEGLAENTVMQVVHS